MFAVHHLLRVSAYCVFFSDPAPTEIYTLSLHDALPIYRRLHTHRPHRPALRLGRGSHDTRCGRGRSEEHTSELQSHSDLVCRLLLEKKKESPISRRERDTKR